MKGIWLFTILSTFYTFKVFQNEDLGASIALDSLMVDFPNRPSSPLFHACPSIMEKR